MKKHIIILIAFFAICFGQKVQAQDLLKGKDLGSIQVDYMTDTEIEKIMSQLEAKNMKIDEVETMAISKGMSASEFSKLKNRIKELENKPEYKEKKENQKKKEQKKKDDKKKENKAKGGEEEEEEQQEDDIIKQEKVKNDKVKDSLNALIFGSELFDNPTLNFQPNLKLATPVNYILGPGDELQVNLYGVQEFNETASVSLEGKIKIQYVGQIAVAGLTIEAATQKIKSAVGKVYNTVRSGQSNLSIALSRIRTIKVTIIGSRQPGNYSVSSLATVYNALHLAGGPGKNGSYRNIELVRNNKVIKTIDLYRFIMTGDQSDNIGLKDNDVIRIPVYKNRVTIEGEVNRPGIFEMKSQESFKDLLTFASGFNEFAYTASVNVLQKTGKQLKVKDIKEDDFTLYHPMQGDVYKVTKILNRFENRIKIEGAVYRPNNYSLYEGMKVSDLIKLAEGLKEDAYTKRATIVRQKGNLTTEILNVDLDEVFQGDTAADILLKKEDVLTVYSILDFREEYVINIDGEVRNPGEYQYYDKLTLNDLFITAGGLTGSASKNVEVARMIRAEEVDEKSDKRVELFRLEINAQSNEQDLNFELKPFDVVNVRRMAVSNKPESVIVSGAVHYPGKYVLMHKKERVSDVIERSGGLLSTADKYGIRIKRPIKQEQIEELENVNLNLGKKDSIHSRLTKKLKTKLKYATIPIDYDLISKKHNHYSNVILLPEDEIEIAYFNEAVKVTGNVLLTSEIPYKKGKRFGYYLRSVGGIDAKGWKGRSYVIYPNGSAAVARRFLFIKRFPKVKPGSQIVVPEKPETRKMSTGEWVSLASVLTSMGVLILTFIK